jgi:hypothetical protein
LAKFDPRSFDSDIYVREVKGLGRGQGFEEVGRRSALNDHSVISKVKPRLLELVELLLSRGLLTREEVSARLGLPTPSEEESPAQLSTQLQSAQGDLEDLEEDVENVAYDLADAAGVYLDENDTPTEKLQAARNATKDELQASLESMEGAAAEIFRIIDVQDDVEDEDAQEKLQRALKLLREDYRATEESEEDGGDYEIES